MASTTGLEKQEVDKLTLKTLAPEMQFCQS